jgi:hypothetical protein
VDWPVFASNVLIAVAMAMLTAAPIVGAAGGWQVLPRSIAAAFAISLFSSFALLAFSWRTIPGGIRAAAYGHGALIVAFAALVEVGFITRKILADRLHAAMAALGVGVLLVAGIFAMAPLTEEISPALAQALLLANPLVAVTSAAGIDLLHLDTIYRTSPLAHRGVAVPAWTTACAVYAVVGLAAFGASRIRLWSPRT